MPTRPLEHTPHTHRRGRTARLAGTLTTILALTTVTLAAPAGATPPTDTTDISIAELQAHRTTVIDAANATTKTGLKITWTVANPTADPTNPADITTATWTFTYQPTTGALLVSVTTVRVDGKTGVQQTTRCLKTGDCWERRSGKWQRADIKFVLITDPFANFTNLRRIDDTTITADLNGTPITITLGNLTYQVTTEQPINSNGDTASATITYSVAKAPKVKTPPKKDRAPAGNFGTQTWSF